MTAETPPNEALRGPESHSEGLSEQSRVTGPEDVSEGLQSPSDDDHKPPREQRYRIERNEARARVEQLLTREAERLASKHLSNPADLFSIGGAELSSLLDDQGDVDPEKVEALAVEILGSRPGLGVRQPATDPTQGRFGGKGKPKADWSVLLSPN